MPIIEPAIPERPLSQGDVLKGVALFTTKDSWAEAGGEPKRTTHKLCLVISRPCVVGHKPNALVAAIEKMADNVPGDVKTFADVRDFLTDLRDGSDSPDVFYLGQVPGFDGRFAARLDSLHTVQIPEEANQRNFTDQKRIGRLNEDFVRDLHVRLFRAFGTLGFDDHRWMSTQDLGWLVARGRQEIHEARAALEDARTQLLGAEARGFRHSSEKQKLEAVVASAEKTLADLTGQVAPYETEFTSRARSPQV